MNIGIDLDGTLISCKNKHVALLGAIAKYYGVKVDLEYFWLLKRNGFNTYESLINQGVESFLVEKINRDWCCFIENIEWLLFDSLLPGVNDFLIKAKNNGIKLHLVSARNSPINAYFQLRQLNIDQFFETITFVSSNRNESKQDVFFKRKIDIYVGDTEYDFNESLNANIQCYLVSSGMRSKEYLNKYSFNIFDNILNVLDIMIKKGR